MSKKKPVNIWKRGIVHLMNLDHWKLKYHSKENSSHIDAYGLTPKGIECVIAFRLINKHSVNKTIEKDLYDKLMLETKLKLYYVFDFKGNYLYVLDNMDFSTQTESDVYFMSESQSSIMTRYSDL